MKAILELIKKEREEKINTVFNGTCVWQVPSQNLINNDII